MMFFVGYIAAPLTIFVSCANELIDRLPATIAVRILSSKQLFQSVTGKV